MSGKKTAKLSFGAVDERQKRQQDSLSARSLAEFLVPVVQIANRFKTPRTSEKRDMIDPEREELFDLYHLPDGMPAVCRPNHRTIRQWIHEGVGGVKLECVRVGARLFSSREAMDRFSARITEAADRVRQERYAEKLAAKRSTVGAT